MGKLVPLSRTPSSAPSFLEGFGIDEQFFQGEFKPVCSYLKSLDWFTYLAQDCSYVQTYTADPYVGLLKYRGEVVGMRIFFFSQLPQHHRWAFLKATGVSPDDIVGFDDLWRQSARETAPGVIAAQSKFFKELRQREALYKGDPLYDSGFPTTGGRHERVMNYIDSLDPNRLP